MNSTQGTPLQPTGSAPASSPSQTPKIPIEPGRMQVIKEAFESYKNKGDTQLSWAQYKIGVATQLNHTDVKALSGRIGALATKDGLDFINWLDENHMIHQKTDVLNTFIENNFWEKEPDEVVQPRPSDVKTKAERREAITAAYQEYMDVDPANPENKIAAYNTFIDKVNEQMIAQEVKEIVLAYGAFATISNFKELIRWLEGQPDLSAAHCAMLHRKDPTTVKRMMDTIFPSNKL